MIEVRSETLHGNAYGFLSSSVEFSLPSRKKRHGNVVGCATEGADEGAILGAFAPQQQGEAVHSTIDLAARLQPKVMGEARVAWHPLFGSSAALSRLAIQVCFR
jgi:hypothetical protein